MYIYILHAKPPIHLPTSVRSMLAVNKQMSFFNYCEKKKTNYMYVTIVRQFYSLRDSLVVLYSDDSMVRQFYTPTTQWSDSSILRRLNGPTVLISHSSMRC